MINVLRVIRWAAGKLVRLRQKLSSATSAVKNFFSGGQGAGEPDLAVQKLEQLQVRACV